MKNGLGNLSATNVGQLTAIIKNRLKASSTSLASPSNPNRRRPQPFNVCSSIGHLIFRPCDLRNSVAALSARTERCPTFMIRR